MSKDKKSYDAKELFLRGMLAFGRMFGGFNNPMAGASEHKNYSINEARARRKSHAKFKAQCAARRQQRKAA